MYIQVCIQWPQIALKLLKKKHKQNISHISFFSKSRQILFLVAQWKNQMISIQESVYVDFFNLM